jgi:peptide deformylase
VPVLRICKFGEDVLARKTELISAWDDELELLVRDMEETMHAARGVGLAANQVGIGRRLAIIDLEPGTAQSHLWVLRNPEIVESSGSIKDDEGCLSIPGLSAPVDRPERVVVRYIDQRGDEQFVEGEGLLARALCHEIDHLNGMLFPQRIPGMRGDLFKRRVKKMSKSGEWDEVVP